MKCAQTEEDLAKTKQRFGCRCEQKGQAESQSRSFPNLNIQHSSILVPQNHQIIVPANCTSCAEWFVFTTEPRWQ